MKKFKILMLLTAMIAGVFGIKAQPTMTVAERVAQNKVMDYLKKQGFNVEIDRNDNSVLFKQRDVLYWITFKGNTSGILYTLHRRPIKLDGTDTSVERSNIRKEKAIAAANILNREEAYKTTVNNGKVNICFSVYASSPDEYIHQLTNVFKSMENAKAEFDKAYAKGGLYVDSIHTYWAKNDTSRVILPQVVNGVTHKASSGMNVSKIEVGSFAGNGNELVPYGGQLLRSKTQYIGERISFSAAQPGIYYIGVKLFDPAGRLIAPDKESPFTTVKEYDVKKAGKSYDVDLEPFGTSNTNFWTPGQYKLEIYDADVLVRSDLFLIEE